MAVASARTSKMLIRLLLLLLFGGVVYAIYRGSRPHPLLQMKREWKALGNKSPVVAALLAQRQTVARLVRKMNAHHSLLREVDTGINLLCRLNDIAPGEVDAAAVEVVADTGEVVRYVADCFKERGVAKVNLDKIHAHRIELVQNIEARRELEGRR